MFDALSHAPRYYTMGGRSEGFDLDLSKDVTYEATDGTGTKTIDYVTRELRSSVKVWIPPFFCFLVCCSAEPPDFCAPLSARCCFGLSSWCTCQPSDSLACRFAILVEFVACRRHKVASKVSSLLGLCSAQLNNVIS